MSVLIRKKKTIRKYSTEQINEIKKCSDPINGPLYFMTNYCYVQRKGIEKFVPYEYQKEFIYNIHNFQRLISMQARQSGKCLEKSINISIRNKKTGEIITLPIGEFYERIKKEYTES